MEAWRFIGAGQALVRATVAMPQPGPGEVLIEVRAAGLCHTDIGILDDPGWAPRLGPLPLTLGHEVAGVIAAADPSVSGCSAGDPVGVSPAGKTRLGLGRDGGYASHCVALAEDLVPVPAGVGFVQAAAGTDAGKTARHAVRCRGQVTAGQRVAVIGLGGIGQVATRLAVLEGATVFVAEPRDSLWPLARELGAVEAVRSVSELADAELDTIIDLAGTGPTTRQAIAAVRRGGTVVQVGLASLEAEISTRDLVTRQVSLVGSSGGSCEDIAAVYELMASGAVAPELPTIGFDDIPVGLDRLRAGSVVGRLVAAYE